MKAAVVIAVLGATAYSQPCRVGPSASPRQGDVLRIECGSAVEHVALGDRTYPLFQTPGGVWAGLVPVPVNQKPGSLKLTAGTQEIAITVRDARFPKQNVRMAPSTQRLQPSPGEMERSKAFRDTLTPQRQWSEPFVSPVPGCVTSPFGVQRLHNGMPTGNFHGGLDQRGDRSTPIRATAAGTVRLVAMWNIHGGTVGVDHGQGVTSMYLHMSKFAVAEGAQVKKGDLLGYVGTTGRSTAPHLHWGLFVHGVTVNPTRWVAVRPCVVPRKKRR